MSSNSERTAKGGGQNADRPDAKPGGQNAKAGGPAQEGCLLGPAEKTRTGVPTDPDAHITVRDLTLAYGDFVVMRDLDFVVKRADVFMIMGGSGCGKSTLLRALLGLL